WFSIIKLPVPELDIFPVTLPWFSRLMVFELLLMILPSIFPLSLFIMPALPLVEVICPDSFIRIAALLSSSLCWLSSRERRDLLLLDLFSLAFMVPSLTNCPCI
ncbi:hypothetical protein, partial [Campylobacter hepaticus]|uniref:hypothetical protein n=1 Tax=Campylobacter hepaticus TaxID=1813019 RepID=UPI001404C584